MIRGIILMVAGSCFLALAIINFVAYMIFKIKPCWTDKARASLKETKHKKNVIIWSFKPSADKIFLKNLTKAKYEYQVNDKKYTIKDDYIGTPNQTPNFVSVVYLKNFPHLAYIKAITITEARLEKMRFVLYAILCIIFATFCLIGGISIL